MKKNVKLPKHIEKPDPEIYLKGRFLCIDFETTNNHNGDARYDNRIVRFAWKMLGGKLATSTDTNLLKQMIEGRSWDYLLAQNAKFELQHLMKLGVDISDILVYDTMLAEKVIVSNQRLPLDLGSISKRYGGTPKEYLIDTLMKGGVCPSEMPESLLIDRVTKDVEDTIFVHDKQLDVLRERNLLGVTYTKNLMVNPVAEMEMKGLYLDDELVIQLAREANSNLEKVSNELDAFNPGMNWSSGKQKAEFLFGDLGFEPPKRFGKPMMTPSGDRPSTDVNALAALKPKTKAQKAVLSCLAEYGKLDKAVSTYHNKFVDAVYNNECHVYGNINQAVTATQRLSSSNPNLQNIDRTLKKVVTARNEGWRVGQRDYAQLEFRVAVHLADCEQGKRDIADGVDVHKNTATVLFDSFSSLSPEEKRYSELRTNAKSDTFKPLYGGTSGTKKQQKYYKYFLDRYSGISQWQKALMMEALDTDKVVAPTGLIFYFPNTRLQRNDSGNVTNHTNIKNYPVQYFATGEIAILGTVFMYHYMKAHNCKSFLVNQVHDSVITEEHPDEHELLNSFTKEAMVDRVEDYLYQVYGIEIRVPLGVDIELNDNWGYDK